MLNAAAWYWCLAKCAMVAAEFLSDFGLSLVMHDIYLSRINSTMENQLPTPGIDPGTLGTLGNDLSTGPLSHDSLEIYVKYIIFISKSKTTFLSYLP